MNLSDKTHDQADSLVDTDSKNLRIKKIKFDFEHHFSDRRLHHMSFSKIHLLFYLYKLQMMLSMILKLLANINPFTNLVIEIIILTSLIAFILFRKIPPQSCVKD